MAANQHKWQTPHYKDCQAILKHTMAVCWVCGQAMLGLEPDHIMPLVPSSPLASACRSCNSGRKNKLPTDDEMHRLFWSPSVWRDVPADLLRESVRRASCDVFGSVLWMDLMLAATTRMKVAVTARQRARAKVCNERLEILRQS